MEFVSKVLSLNNQELLKYIPGLEKQYAVVLGEAFSYSDIVKICTADPKPKSDAQEVINNWVDRLKEKVKHSMSKKQDKKIRNGK